LYFNQRCGWAESMAGDVWRLPQTLGRAETQGRHPIDAPAFFMDTRFAVAGKIAVQTTQTISVWDLASRMLSFSSSSPAILGDRIEEMLDGVRAAMLPTSNNGAITEVVET
jgi:hypothetical protein